MFWRLRLRMALSHAALLLLTMLVLGTAGYLLLARSLDRTATATATGAANNEAEHVAETGRVTQVPDDDVPSSSAVRVAVFRMDGSVIDEAGEVPTWLRPGVVPASTLRVLGERVRLATVPLVADGHRVGTVVAALSLTPGDRLLGRIRLLLALGGLIATAASAVAGWILAGRAVRPLRSVYEAQAAFVADASHELRTPLAFVRSGVEVLATHEPGLASEVVEEVEYLSRLTDRLVTLARSDSGTLDLPSHSFAVSAVCREALGRHRTLGASVEVRVAGDDLAMANRDGLRAAIDAVLENVDRHGGATADLSVRRRDGLVEILVADHGPGLTAEQRALAFDRFFRADRARGHRDGGAGLGLTLARTLVEAQGGIMRLEETPGGGLTAVIGLRAAT